jgi:uncharacterized lipoprotein YddW (UPF0748 family)/peptidoglycan/xylan/chitin deacetylase (PgdA/CDA1 family)
MVNIMLLLLKLTKPWSSLIFVVSLVALAAVAQAKEESAQTAAKTPVLLTFDVKYEEDIQGLKELNMKVPVTYFLVGQFIEQNTDFVRKLAKEDVTLGSLSYSHPHLKALDSRALKEELLRSVSSFEAVVGKRPRWFRAPFLEYDDEAMMILKELGVTNDSSDAEIWRRNQILRELPISNHASVLASDYDVFMIEKLADAAALDWFKKLYNERRSLQRPVVIVLHPHIAAKHAQVLRQFVDFVRNNNGIFVTADAFVDMVMSRRAESLALWIDFSIGKYSPDDIVADAKKLEISDVFVMAADPEGNLYFRRPGDNIGDGQDVFGKSVETLKAAGLRVHAWLPVNKNQRLAQERPEWAMKQVDGTPSKEWLSPLHPGARENFLKTVAALLDAYPLDGVHLDYIRYPSLDYDFSETAVARFREDSGVGKATLDQIVTTHYNAWVDWRSEQITAQVRDVRTLVRGKKGKDIVVSAALIGGSAIDYRLRELFGQDYARLAPDLDIVIPMAYFHEEAQSVDWTSDVVLATREAVGNKPVYIGLETYQHPPEWSFDPIDFSHALDSASVGSNGIVFYSYGNLFGRGPVALDLPPGALDHIKAKQIVRRANNSQSQLASLAQNAVGRPVMASDFRAPLFEGAISRPHIIPDLLPKANASEVLPTVSAVTSVNADWVKAMLLDEVTPVEEGAEYDRGFLLALMAVTAVVLLALAPLMSLKIIRRRRALSQSSAQGSVIATVDAENEPSSWRDLARQCELPVISVGIWSRVSRQLQQLSSSEIERNRMYFLLDLVREYGSKSLQSLTEAFRNVPGWSILGGRYLEEAGLLRYAYLGLGEIYLSEQGANELKRGRANGFDRDRWEFVERRLHEVLMVECPHCGEATVSQWYWTDFTCRQCKSRVQAVQSRRIIRRTIDEGPVYYQRV